MRHILFILMGISAMLGLSLLSASGLTVTSLQKQLAGSAKITVVDIRNPAAYAEEHIPGAINIPASLCPAKNLPPLGQVVVYGDGLDKESTVTATAAAALAAKPGIKVEILDGGFASWKSSKSMTTRGPGLKHESFNYISYAHLKAAKKDSLVLYDLRKAARSKPQSFTDLNAEFPGLKQAKTRSEAVKSVAVSSSLVVLIDNGDGLAEQEARQLKLSGTHNYVILAGGEGILSRHGEAGLQHSAGGVSFAPQQPTLPGTAK